MSGRRYFVHDRTRGFIGNSMVWWRWNHRGYTPNIDEAHQFSESELEGMADDLSAYPVDEVRAVSEPHVTRPHDLRHCERRLGEGNGSNET